MKASTSKKTHLEFQCTKCQAPVPFSALDPDEISKILKCDKCQKEYVLGKHILTQLKQFEALCQQIQRSKSIFGQAAIAVDVGPHHVKIPFQLLLTRLSSVLDLNINGENSTITFRVDTMDGPLLN